MKSMMLFGMFLGIGAAVSAAEQTLYEFKTTVPQALLETRNADVAKTERNTLAVTLKPDPGWPGITLKAPEGKWDLSPFMYINLRGKNVGTEEVNVGFRVDNEGANGSKHCLQEMQVVPAGKTFEFRVPIVRADDMQVKLFGMRGYPIEVGGGMGGDKSVDPKEILCVLIFTFNPGGVRTIEIERIWASGVYQTGNGRLLTDNFFPFIDTFGQYIHRDWPGKVKDVADLQSRIAVEERDLATHPGPADWDKWGGWANGPSLPATGFFRTAKYADKWWLVDPDGKLFISHGPNCVGESGATPIEERDNWFQNLGDNGDALLKDCFGKAWFVVNGHYQGRQPRTFDFARANSKRKYGDDWYGKAAAIAHRRLRSWGMNTIANWSDRSIYLLRKTPYFVCLGAGGKVLQGSEGYWGQFKDVFDPSFAESIRGAVEGQRATTATDSWCIGYFVDNEIAWGDETSLAIAALVSPADQAAKQEFIRDLQKKYADIAALNAVWGTSYASWDALKDSRTAPDKAKAGDDLRTFYRKFAMTYFKTIRDAVKAVAPNHLYAGCRFAWVNDIAAEEAAKYCDIVSYNLYRRDVAEFEFPGKKDVPLIIGEFHFGALDRGMFHTGLVITESQEERAAVYKSYVEGMLRHPQFVGCHWFKYQDEPTTGRPLDGENYQIGFVDIADTPYPEIIGKCREIGYRMYEYRLKNR